MDHGARLHSIWGASSAYRRALCPGSVKQSSLAPPERANRFRDDGTEAHELLDFALKNRIDDASIASAMHGTVDRDTATEAGDRLGAVQVALDYVYALLDIYPDAVLYVEHQFKFPSFVTDDAFGTNDVLIHVPSLRMAFVIDYKHGAGVAVEIMEEMPQGKVFNLQTMYYGTGAVEGSGNLDVDTAVLVIIQPRCFHPKGPIRDVVVTREDMQQFIFEEDARILACMADDAPLIPGEKQCQFCPAKFTCPAREARALTAVSQTFASYKDINTITLPDPRDMPIDKLVYLLQAEDFVNSYFQDVRKYAMELALEGKHIPDHKLVEAQARRTWDGEPEVIARELMRLANTDDWDKVYPRKLVTITEADKLVGDAFKARFPRGKKKQGAEAATIALSALTVKESSGNLTLVSVTDKRPAVDRAATAFRTVTIPPPQP